MWHACGRRENCTRFWWESLKESDRSEGQGIGGRMESEWTLGRLACGVWIGFKWLRIGLVADCCECGDEPSGFCATESVKGF
jgi:hypothetical protein